MLSFFHLNLLPIFYNEFLWMRENKPIISAGQASNRLPRLPPHGIKPVGLLTQSLKFLSMTEVIK